MADGGAGNRGRRKRRPLCSGADTGCVSKIDYMAGLRKQADFLLELADIALGAVQSSRSPAKKRKTVA